MNRKVNEQSLSTVNKAVSVSGMPAVVAIFAAVFLPTLAAPLEVVGVLGDAGDELLLHRPSHVVFAEDGSAYILNRGDCTILHMSSGGHRDEAVGVRNWIRDST